MKGFVPTFVGLLLALLLTALTSSSFASPNDPLYNTQDHLEFHNVEKAWSITSAEGGPLKLQSSSDIIVAVIDTGVDINHEDIKGNLWTNPGETPGNGIDDDGNGFIDDTHGWDFYNGDNEPEDDHGHGTQVAGAIAAITNNGIGIASIPFIIKIIPLRITNDDGIGSVSKAIKAMNYAADKKAQVINLSFTIDNPEASDSKQFMTLVEELAQKGIVIVMAAGNEGNHLTILNEAYGKMIQNGLLVGAVDAVGELTTFSNWGNEVVHILAMGTGVHTTYKDDDYGYVKGTSIAAPIVSATAALLKSINPQFSAQAIKDFLMNGSIYKQGLTDATMSGILNIAGAVDQAAVAMGLQASVSTKDFAETTSPGNGGGCSLIIH